LITTLSDIAPAWSPRWRGSCAACERCIRNRRPRTSTILAWVWQCAVWPSRWNWCNFKKLSTARLLAGCLADVPGSATWRLTPNGNCSRWAREPRSRPPPLAWHSPMAQASGVYSVGFPTSRLSAIACCQGVVWRSSEAPPIWQWNSGRGGSEARV